MSTEKKPILFKKLMITSVEIYKHFGITRIHPYHRTSKPLRLAVPNAPLQFREFRIDCYRTRLKISGDYNILRVAYCISNRRRRKFVIETVMADLKTILDNPNMKINTLAINRCDYDDDDDDDYDAKYEVLEFGKLLATFENKLKVECLEMGKTYMSSVLAHLDVEKIQIREKERGRGVVDGPPELFQASGWRNAKCLMTQEKLPLNNFMENFSHFEKLNASIDEESGGQEERFQLMWQLKDKFLLNPSFSRYDLCPFKLDEEITPSLCFTELNGTGMAFDYPDGHKLVIRRTSLKVWMYRTTAEEWEHLRSL